MTSLQECAELVEALPDPLLLTAADGVVVAANRAAGRLLGVAHSRLAGRPLPMLFTALPEPLAQALGHRPHRVEFVGGESPIEVEVCASALGGGLLIRIAPPAEELQGQISALRRELAQTQRTARIGRLEWEPEQNRVNWSAELARLTGLPHRGPREFADFLARIHPDDREPVLHAIARSRRERSSFCLRHRIVRPGGQLRYVVARGNWESGPGGVARKLTATLQDVSAQRRTEEALALESRRRQLVLAHTPDAFLMLDRAGYIRDANPAYCELVGYPREELLGTHISTVHTEGAERDRDWIAATLAGVLTGERKRFEVRHRTRTGGSVDFEVSAIAIEHDPERAIYAFLHDITERKRHEQALARSASEWRQVIDAVPDPLYMADAVNRLVRANRAFYALIGCAPEQAVGRVIAEVLPHPPPQAYRRGEPVMLELEPDAPGNPTGLPIEFRQVPLRDREGSLTGTVTLLHDLTRQRNAEEAIVQLARRNQLLLDSTGEGIIGIDPSGRAMFVNPAAEQLLGYTREELLAAPSIHALIHHTKADGTPYPVAECPMSRALTTGEGGAVSTELLYAKNGTSFPSSYSAHPILTGDRISGAVVVLRNVAEINAMVLKLDFLATHDTLTGLLNRYEFERRLDEALRNARSSGSEHVLCYIDLDQFKIVNDTCGHVAGDELLQQLAALLNGKLRPEDTLARLGGDEFGVLFENTSLNEALRSIDELRSTVSGFRFVWEQKPFALGMSVGVLTITRDTESVAAALSAADTACYVAKEAGRNRVHVHRENDAELTRHRGEMLWVGRLREALEQNRFVLHYQPIVPLQPGGDHGECYEILLTLRDPAGLDVPPGAFLPAAERFNLMPAIDRWVVGGVLDWLALNPERVQRLELCTINLSANTLGDGATLEFIVEALRRSGVPPDRIGFEITETAAIANLPQALAFMRRLADIGCRFALDDFGSGMSSFGYLKNLPVDFLKIDGAFVRDIANDQVDRAMVKAINHVGQVMNIRTIAEHLESSAVLEVLREIGVDFGQGFRTGRPRELTSMPRPR